MALTTNAQRVIVERHHGWEGASPSLLARVFDTTPQRITSIIAQKCAVCDQPICGHRDDEWSGAQSLSNGSANAVAPSRTVDGSGCAVLSHPTPPETR